MRPVALPSAVADHDLLFSAVVHWRWAGHVDLRMRNPVGPAVLAAVTRAADLARGTDPGNHGLAECELAARLAVENAVSGSGIVMWAEEVSLRPSEEDAERLRRLLGLRKDHELRESLPPPATARRPLRDRAGRPPGMPAAQYPLRDAEEDLVGRAPWAEQAAWADRPDSAGRNGRSRPATGGSVFGGPDPLDDALDGPLDGSLDDPSVAPPGEPLDALLDEPLGDLLGDSPDDEELPPPAGPGSDVDGDGYESYWWPADSGGGHEAAERDVQVAILRGLIDSVEGEQDRVEFAHEQLRILESGGFDDVAQRVREACPELGDEAVPGRADLLDAPRDGA